MIKVVFLLSFPCSFASTLASALPFLSAGSARSRLTLPEHGDGSSSFGEASPHDKETESGESSSSVDTLTFFFPLLKKTQPPLFRKKKNRACRRGRSPPGLPPVAVPFPAGGLPRRRVRSRGRGAASVPAQPRRKRRRGTGGSGGDATTRGGGGAPTPTAKDREESLGAPRRGAGRAPRLPGGPPLP